MSQEIAKRVTTRWRRQEKVTGLARVTAGVRHWRLVRSDGLNDVTLISTMAVGEFGVVGRYGPYKFRITVPGQPASRSIATFPDVEACKAAADEWYKANKKRFEGVMP